MIEFTNVSKVYDNGTKALNNVSLRVDKGEFVFVVGPSGAGKSTFIKLLLREETPTKGIVKVNGYNLNKIKKRQIPQFRRSLGVVFQDFRLIPQMTVYDNVAFALRVTNVTNRYVSAFLMCWDWLALRQRQETIRISFRVVSSSVSRWQGLW